MIFHVLGIPHTVSTPEYSSCAFTQKVVKLCAMLKMEGHTVYHYGHENSKVSCDENIRITYNEDLKRSYPGHDWRKSGWPQFSKDDLVYQVFYAGAVAEIRRRSTPGDFLLCSFGDFHKPVADQLPTLMAVEPGIGYPNGTFAPFKVYESYAIMHAYQTNGAAMASRNDFWFDAVIPNAFDLKQFKYSAKKQNHFLFLGRINDGKGFHIAKQIAETTKTKLIVAGQAEPGVIEESKYVKHVGVVGPAERAKLLTNAKAIICASTYLEPFCGVQIEAMISGTPVISSDWGAFAEYNKHDITGYRCKTFEQFVWAANNIGKLDPAACKLWGEKFSLQKIAPMYTEYFQMLHNVRFGKGWYQENEGRKSLSHVVFQ